MNIAVLLTDFGSGVGGIATFNRCFVQALQALAVRNSWSIAVVSLNDPPDAVPPLETTAGFSFDRCNRKKLIFIRNALRRATQADLVFFGHAHFIPLAWLLKKPKKILIAHGIEVWTPLSRVRLSALRWMQRVWGVSRYTLDQMMILYQIRRDQCRVFPNTLIQDVRSVSGQASLQLPAGKMLLTVSRLCATETYKRIDGVLMALPAVLKRHPEAYYVIVGDGSDRKRLEARCRALGIEKNVRFAGQVDPASLSCYYQGCDVFVLPSLEEGFGIVFLEAMSYSKPCIGALAGGVPEVIDHNRTGYLIRPDDVDSLAQAIQRLLGDPEKARNMGAAGRIKFEREFAFDRFQLRMQLLLRKELEDVQDHRMAA